MVYYYLKRTTPVNYFAIKKMASFRAADAQLAAPVAIDDLSPETAFGEPIARVEDFYLGGRNVTENIVTGYDPGVFRVPDYRAKSFMWWYYVFGGCTTVSAAQETHTIIEADALPFLGIHTELEHATDADSQRRDLLGVVNQRGSISWSQEGATTQSFEFLVAKAIAGADTVRPTGMDNRAAYHAGHATSTFEYNGNPMECIVMGGTIDVTNTIEFHKVNDEFATEAVILNRTYDITLDVRSSGDTLFDIPSEPADYAGALTLVQRIYKSATDYGEFTFDNLWMEPLHAVRIQEGDFIWKAQIKLHNAGSNIGAATVGTCGLVVVDDLTIASYEVA